MIKLALQPAAVDGLVTQTWFDPRLIHNPAVLAGGGGALEGVMDSHSMMMRGGVGDPGGRRGGGGGGGGLHSGEAPYLDGTYHADSIWMPRAYFRRSGRREEGDVSIKIYGNGTVEYTVR